MRRDGVRNVARWSTPALLVVLALPACRRDAQKMEEAAAERAAEKKPSGEREQPGEAPAKADIASAPAELLKPGAVKRIQAALGDRGHLEGRASGNLDGQTRTALQKFQRAEKLPETGLPDHETIRQLGLGIDDVFLKNVSGAEASAAMKEHRRTQDGQEKSPSEVDPREAKSEKRDRPERQGRRERRPQ